MIYQVRILCLFFIIQVIDYVSSDATMMQGLLRGAASAPVVGSLGGYTAPNSGDQGRIKRLIRAPGEIIYNFLPSGGISVGLNNIIPASAAITFNGYDARGARLYDATYGSLPGRLVDPILNIFPSRTRGALRENPNIYKEIEQSLQNDPNYIATFTNNSLQYWSDLAQKLRSLLNNTDENSKQASNVENITQAMPVISKMSELFSNLLNIPNSNSATSSGVFDLQSINYDPSAEETPVTLPAPPSENQSTVNYPSIEALLLNGLESLLTTESLLSADLLNGALTPDWRIGSDWLNALQGGLYGFPNNTITGLNLALQPTSYEYSGNGLQITGSTPIDPPLTTETTISPSAQVGSQLDALTEQDESS